MAEIIQYFRRHHVNSTVDSGAILKWHLHGEGGTQKADDSTDKLRECDSDKEEGGQQFSKFCGRHLCMVPYLGNASKRSLLSDAKRKNIGNYS